MDMLRLAEVAARHRVTLLLQHGSMVSGRVHAQSDLDIAALFEADDVSLADVAALSAEVQDLNPGREVDVAVLNHADPVFLKLVIEKCRLLYGSPRRLAELGMYAYKRYQDHRRFLALEQSYVKLRSAGRHAAPCPPARRTASRSALGGTPRATRRLR